MTCRRDSWAPGVCGWSSCRSLAREQELSHGCPAGQVGPTSLHFLHVFLLRREARGIRRADEAALWGPRRRPPGLGASPSQGAGAAGHAPRPPPANGRWGEQLGGPRRWTEKQTWKNTAHMGHQLPALEGEGSGESCPQPLRQAGKPWGGGTAPPPRFHAPAAPSPPRPHLQVGPQDLTASPISKSEYPPGGW